MLFPYVALAHAQCVSIELTRNYGLTEFRESIKKLYKWVVVLTG